jgi:glycosyltransferase involved in cell wall biosynthesis
VPEIITAGVDGGLARPGNVTDYMAELIFLLADERQRADWARAGRATVEQRFSLERVFADFDQVMASV